MALQETPEIAAARAELFEIENHLRARHAELEACHTSNQPKSHLATIRMAIRGIEVKKGAAEKRLKTAQVKARKAALVAGDMGSQGAQSNVSAEWDEHVDTQSGKKFYVNKLTRRSTWTDPGSKPAVAGALPDGWTEQKDPSTGNTFYYNATTGASTWTRPEATETNWIEQTDPGTGNKFYYNKLTGESSWTKPDCLQPQQAQSSSSTSQAQIEWTEHLDAQSGRKYFVNNSTRRTTWTQPPELGGLPDGWKEQIDPQSGNPFYYNAATGESSWTKPAPAASQGNPLPAGWTSHLDQGSGKTYYYNATTGATSWELPPG